jgi:hypothetical protein
MNDPRKRAPSVARNRDPIVEVLRRFLPERGLALEVASGSGEHVVYFAEHFPQLEFLPSDPDESARLSISAWIDASGLSNIQAPIALDAVAPDWPLSKADAIICINMTHISPWAATEGLFEAAGRLLCPRAPLYLYGPYKRHGAHTAESNQAFDEWQRRENSQWGCAISSGSQNAPPSTAFRSRKSSKCRQII